MSHLYAGNETGDASRTTAALAPRESLSFPLEEASQVGEVRRAATALAGSSGFDEVAQSNLAIIVTEAANNILRHAGRGEIVLRLVEGNGVLGVELLALDKGPGMSSIPECMQDGFSTGGTSGTGLGAISRLSSSLSLYSRSGLGTALLAYLWPKTAILPEPARVGVVNRSKPGQQICGDSWAVKKQGPRQVFLLVDGLGHGPDAARASHQAVSAFGKNAAQRPGAVLERIHTALHGTRGAAAAIAEVDEDTQALTFAGVGNIAGTLFMADESTSMVSHYGIIGYQVRKIQEFTYPCPPLSLLVLRSDGIANLGLLAAYPGLTSYPAALIAGVIYRDFQRGNDDATILVAKMPRTETGAA